MVTSRSAKTGLNSTWTTVATLLKTSSSTSLLGRALTPADVTRGDKIVKVVLTVVNGAVLRCAEIRLVPAAQEGPPHRAAVALPSSSSVTVNVGPSWKANGYGRDQLN